MELYVRLLKTEGPGLREAEPKKTLAKTTLRLKMVRPDENHKRTFVSRIDKSVQYYAVNPARPLAGGDTEGLALFLSAHGAGVEATSQANSYGPKTWGHVVAPTNRRPYGFSWEEWGRIDALEVIEIALQSLKPDPSRVYLSGHSMGGHGSWHLGSHYPDKFAAIGPCAAAAARWPDSEEDTPRTPMGRMLRRAMVTTDLEASGLTRNLQPLGVYILHGGADAIVPVKESRKMADHLGLFHRNFVYHEEPGQGHWWENSDEAGAECQDWPAMYDLFARSRIPETETVRHVEFHTANPGVSASAHWVSIEAQAKALKPSSVDMRYDPWMRRFTGTTENVARLALDLKHLIPDKAIQVEIDGQQLGRLPIAGSETRVWFTRNGGKWARTAKPSPDLKGPQRYGPFKEGMRVRFQLVYGTRGSGEENAWAWAKARYDAEQFWYAGNGSLDVVADVDFDPNSEPDRDVVLYGNADTNAAWKPLLARSPVQVHRGKVRLGAKTLEGRDMACLCVRPRPGSDSACVSFVAGTGPAGMRLTDRVPYFTATVGYPDCIVLTPKVLTDGDKGIRAAGFFGIDWQVDSGDFLWNE